MKPTDSKERLKALMHQHAANANPPLVAVADTTTARAATGRGGMHRVTIRLPASELAKINDVVIATQQAIRSSKVTTTDVLRVALRRVKDQEAISAAEISALRAADARFMKGKTV